MRIKIDQADKVFSEYIRIRDGKCMRCGRTGSGQWGIIGLQNSHYFGRGRENTRFDPFNCDALCGACHRYWGSDFREAYRDFKIKQLGEKGFEALRVRAEIIQGKKDRKLALLVAKQLLKEAKEKHKENLKIL